MGKVGERLRFWFPNYTCVACGCEIKQSANPQLCDDCIAKLPFLPEPSQGHYCPFLYEEPVRKLILKLKYGNNDLVCQALAPYLAATYLQYVPRKKDCVIVPVPLYRRRFLLRGYNQCEVLAEELKAYLDLPVVKDVLLRVKRTTPQKHMTAAERAANVKDAFTIRANADKIKGKNILLLDDTYTTGATTRECAKVLKKFGAKSVSILTIAQAGL